MDALFFKACRGDVYLWGLQTAGPWSFLSQHRVSADVVQPLGRVQLFGTPWTAACQAPLSSTISQSLLKPLSIESVMSLIHRSILHFI